MNKVSAAKIVRFRRECIDWWPTAIAAIAANAAPRPAKTPKWWVHLVGVNMRNSSDAKTMPTIRRVGPLAVPGIAPLRSSIAADTARDSSMISTANRRAIDPLAEYSNSDE